MRLGATHARTEKDVHELERRPSPHQRFFHFQEAHVVGEAKVRLKFCKIPKSVLQAGFFQANPPGKREQLRSTALRDRILVHEGELMPALQKASGDALQIGVHSTRIVDSVVG